MYKKEEHNNPPYFCTHPYPKITMFSCCALSLFPCCPSHSTPLYISLYKKGYKSSIAFNFFILTLFLINFHFFDSERIKKAPFSLCSWRLPCCLGHYHDTDIGVPLPESCACQNVARSVHVKDFYAHAFFLKGGEKKKCFKWKSFVKQSYWAPYPFTQPFLCQRSPTVKQLSLGKALQVCCVFF